MTKVKNLGQAFENWVKASRQEKFVTWIIFQYALKAYKSEARK